MKIISIMDICRFDVKDIKSLYLVYEIVKQLGIILDFFIVSENQYSTLNKDSKLLKEEYKDFLDGVGFINLKKEINSYLKENNMPTLIVKTEDFTIDSIIDDFKMSEIEIKKY